MRSIQALALVLSAAGCGSSSNAVDGPLKLGIESGQNQVAVAGAGQLASPVIGRLVHAQTASGFRFELVKTAYAQTGPTVVNGSPVVGALVCAVSPVPGSMVPFVPCANTDANGHATFYFDPGKKSGSQISEIRGILNGVPTVFDTARATVNAADADPNFRDQNIPTLRSPAVVPANAVVDIYGNAVPFRIVPDNRIIVQDTTTGSVGARTIIFDASLVSNNDFTVELRGLGGLLVGRMRYRIGIASDPQLNVVTAGVNLAP